MGYIVGIDLDNTIVSYDTLIHKISVERGLIKPDTTKSKEIIRDKIRLLEDGENKWQRLQAEIYGTRMSEARLIDGVKEFVIMCKRKEIPVFIVSHKTKYSNLGEDKTDLQESALNWMKENHFFDKKGLDISEKDVFFEKTQYEKIQRIVALKCTHFIDDLKETYMEQSFPKEVTKILYSPHDIQPDISGVTVFNDWASIQEFMQTCFDGFIEEKEKFESLLKEKIERLEQIEKGNNSRVFKIHSTHTKKRLYLGKIYFARTNGSNKINVEFDSLKFLNNNEITNVPEAIIKDSVLGYAIYEFIDGSAVGEVSRSDIKEAVDFLVNINKFKESKTSKKASSILPNAAEACFSFKAIAENIKLRQLKLAEVDNNKLQRFLKEDFNPFFEEVITWSKEKLVQLNLSFEYELDSKFRILSPSDFGFHNALRSDSEAKHLVFFDFEYFGWDDPAKTICDFILHPAMNLSKEQKSLYVTLMLDEFNEDKTLAIRTEIAYPFFGLKWCMIMLNEFLNDDFKRREFAAQEKLDVEIVQNRQLLKAQELLKKIKWEYLNFPYTSDNKSLQKETI